MVPLITKKPENVYRILFNSLDKLIENRIKDKAFTDQEDVTTKGYFSTLEGLEAILIPLVNLPKNLFWQPIIAKRPQLAEILEEDINFILSYNQKPKGSLPPIEQGIPYFIQGKGVRQSPYWTSECASFTLSVLTNLLLLNKNFGLNIGPNNSTIINAIELNLEWVSHCKRDNGWAWTSDSPSHAWPTWSILDTFEEILNNDDFDGDIHGRIKTDCSLIANKIYESFETNVAGSYQNEWNTKVKDITPYDIEAGLNIIRLMLGVSLHRTNRDIKNIATMLFSWCAKTDFKNLDYTCHLAAKNDNIPDGSLVPMTLRTLLVMAGMLKPKYIAKLNDEIGCNHEIIINRVFSHLMKSQITHGRYSGLWGVPNGGITYELYYTERTIEALTEFILQYGNDLKINIKSKEKISSDAKTSSKIEEVATTKKKKISEIPIIPTLPLLDEFARNVVKDKPDLFQNVSLVLVLHILDDLLPLIEKFNNLGCKPNNMYLIAKTYNYPDKEKLISYLKDIGCNIFQPEKADHKSYLETCDTILKKCIAKAKAENRKILIVEDGGYFVPLVHENYGEFIEYFVGAVEQTTKGHRRDADIKNYRIPIISVANSKIKKILEGDEVAQTLQENVVDFIKRFVKKPSHTLNVLVIGYGTIGKNLADYLADKKIRTYVYDNDRFKRMEATLNRKINIIENLDELNNYDIIIGCSGNNSLDKAKYYNNLKHNVYLASGSSESIEFNLELLDSLSNEVITDDIITEYRLKKDKKIVNLVCNGEPINFSLSGGIAKPIIDPIYVEMFLSTVKLMSDDTLVPGLMDVPEDIEIKVLDDYKDHYKT